MNDRPYSQIPLARIVLALLAAVIVTPFRPLMSSGYWNACRTNIRQLVKLEP